MNWKDLIKPPPAEGYIKNSSNLVTALFVLAGILYYPTNGLSLIHIYKGVELSLQQVASSPKSMLTHKELDAIQF